MNVSQACFAMKLKGGLPPYMCLRGRMGKMMVLFHLVPHWSWVGWVGYLHKSNVFGKRQRW